jgi:hypothetical protein
MRHSQHPRPGAHSPCSTPISAVSAWWWSRGRSGPSVRSGGRSSAARLWRSWCLVPSPSARPTPTSALGSCGSVTARPPTPSRLPVGWSSSRFLFGKAPRRPAGGRVPAPHRPAVLLPAPSSPARVRLGASGGSGQANPSGANLSVAYLINANLGGANLHDADLRVGVPRGGRCGARLPGDLRLGPGPTRWFAAALAVPARRHRRLPVVTRSVRSPQSASA